MHQAPILQTKDRTPDKHLEKEMADRGSLRRKQAKDLNNLAGDLVVSTVSAMTRIKHGDFYKDTRGKADTCLARQIAMYLLHTIFSRTYQDVAQYFGRDRTTISYACGLIEDLRDDRDIEALISSLESILHAARELNEALKQTENCR